MKRQSFFRKTLLSGALSTLVLTGVQAQVDFPAFEEVTPEGIPMVFRGSAIWGDYDNDGKLEAVVLGRESEGWAVRGFVLKPNAEGGLYLLTDDLSTIGFPAIDGAKENDVYNPILQWIDYNNDGLMDLLFMGNLYDEDRPDPDNTNPDQSDNDYALFLDLYKNTGSGFERVADTGLEGLYVEEESNYASVISVGDYDNDGYADFIVTGRRNGERHVDLYRNEAGSGRFTRQLTPLKSEVEGTLSAFEPQNAGSVTFADFNNDGWLDIIVNGWNDATNNALVMMYLNNGDGTFKDNMINYDIEDAGSKSQIGVADINGDGYMDFVLSGEYLEGKDNWLKSSSIYYFDKDEYGYLIYSYTAGADIGLGSFQKSSIDFADFNGDGRLDFVLAGETGNGIPSTTIYMQEEEGTFDSLDGENLVGSVRSGAIMTLADYDGDGYLDAMSMGYNNLATGSRQGLHFGVFHNNGNLAKNEAPTAPTNLKAEEKGGLVVFTWDAGTDKETATTALRYNFYLKKPNGEVFTWIPADITTGFLKATHHAASLGSTTLSMRLPAGEYEWGVQTIDQSKTGSAFASSTAVSTASKVGQVSEVKADAFVSDGRIYISTEKQALVSVFDVNGRVLCAENVAVSDFLQTNLAPGAYFVRIQIDGSAKNVKVVL